MYVSQFQQKLGKMVQLPSKLDQKIAGKLLDLANTESDGYKTILGKTMCTTDFYEGEIISIKTATS